MWQLLPLLKRDGNVPGATEMLLVRERNGSWPQKSDPLPVFVEIWKSASAFQVLLVCPRR